MKYKEEVRKIYPNATMFIDMPMDTSDKFIYCVIIENNGTGKLIKKEFSLDDWDKMNRKMLSSWHSEARAAWKTAYERILGSIINKLSR